ncbi:MAG TPA: hypothetical protein VN408_33595 [Actinoplanes sp.]|nr:hypothetical protein [Actinoplanes sp.]
MTEEPQGRLAPAVDPYDPPLVEVDTSLLPPDPPERGNRRLILVVLALAAVLGAGGVVLMVQLWPSAPVASAGPSAPQSADPSVLTALPAGVSASVRSVEDGVDTTITFVNNGTGTVTLSWVDDKGERSPYATVDPGATYEQKTYAGHFWVAAGPDGTVLAVFQATDRPAKALLD